MQKITITRIDGALRVNPAPPYISDFLYYSHRSFKTVNYKRVNNFEKKALHVPDGEGGVITLQGFYSRIIGLLDKNMQLYEVVDLRTKLPEIDWDAVKAQGLRDYQITPTAEFLVAAQADSGIVNATGGYGKTILQAVTYAAFSSLRTILAIPLKQVARQTYKKFKERFPDVHVGLCGDGARDPSEQITITTFRSFLHASPEKCQLLLVDELQQATGDTFQEHMRQARPIRVFGYTATDKNLFNNADKMITGLFGERLIHIDYPEAEEVGAVVPGYVYMLEVPEGFAVHAASMEGKIKQGIKVNRARNQLIGQVCSKVPAGWQCLTFVDHVADHLVQLHSYMPEGTKYLHRESSKKRVKEFALTGKQQDAVIAGFENNEFTQLIATDAFRAGVDIPNLRVVVQGAGGTSEIELLQEALRGSRTLPEERRAELAVSPKTHFVLIDFQDNHDDVLARMADKREGIYKAQGWKVRRIQSVDQIDWNNEKKQSL